MHDKHAKNIDYKNIKQIASTASSKILQSVEKSILKKLEIHNQDGAMKDFSDNYDSSR